MSNHGASGSSASRGDPSSRRSLDDRKSQHQPATADSPSPPRSSSSESLVNGDIEPSWPRPRDLDITRARATGIWHSEQQQQHHQLPDLALDIRWRPASNTAFFKLYSYVRINAGHSRQSSSRVFIFIYPERIRRLSIEPVPEQPNTVAFTWELSTPPVLVVPSAATGQYTHRGPGRRRDNEDEELKSQMKDALLRALASQTKFTVHVEASRRLLPVGQMRLLCAAAVQGLNTDASLADTKSLYWGQGADVIEGSTMVVPMDAPSSPAPAYDSCLGGEQDSLAPPEKTALHGYKRRRVSTSSTTDSPTPPPSDRKAITSIAALLETRLSAIETSIVNLRAEMVGQINAAKTQIYDQLRAEFGAVEDAMEERLESRVAEVEQEVLDRLREGASVKLTFDESSLAATVVFDDL